MAEDNRINGLAWFVAGLGVGALVGILYAPKAGRELREDLVNGTRQAADKVGDLVGRGKEQVGEYVDRGRAQWEEFVERGKSLVSEQTGRVTAAVEAGRQAYKTPPVPEEEPPAV